MTTEEMTWRFHPIAGARAHEEVVDQITFAIRAGLFKPGEHLPHLDELGELMGVSKPTVGQALKVLTENGVLETRRGVSGGITVVSDHIPIKILGMTGGSRPVSLAELVEARRPIETALAMLAGQRGTDRDFETLEEATDRLEALKKRDEPSVWAHYDHFFHYAIGRAARSELLAYYQHGILEQLAIRLSSYFEEQENPDSVVALHRETAEAIKTRDPDGITEAVDHHLQPLERFVEAIEDDETRGAS